MTAMGIIGIILASGVGVVFVMGGIYALLEEKMEQKRKMTCDIVRYAIDAYAEETRKLFSGIMDDAAQKIPDMAKGMYKALEIEEEP